MRLDDIPFVLDDIPTADLWQKVLNTVNSGEMPPEDEPQPADEAKTAFLDALSGTLVTARDQLADSGGEIAMRRLNRREYKNTIRDLLGVDINVRELPADGGAGTFDTVGSSLFMSSDQFEQYLTLGRQALDEHFARYVAPSGTIANAQATTFKIRRESEEVALPQVTKGLASLKADYDRYLKWAAAVDAAAALPENAALAGELRNLPVVKADASLFYMEWAKKQKEPGLRAFGFGNAAVPADARNLKYQYDIRHRDYEDYLAMPHKDTGAYLSYLNGYPEENVRINAKWPAGVYTVRLRVAAADDAPQERRFIEFGQPGSGGFGGGMIVKSSHQITGTMAAPQILEIPVTVPATGGRDYLIREKKPNNNAGLSVVWWESLKKHGAGPKPALWIDWIEVESAASAAVAKEQTFKTRREPEEFANKQVSNWVSGFKQNYERYQQWTAAVDAVAALPENAALAAELRGMDRVKKHASYFYSEWMKRKTEPSPTKFGFRDDEDARFAKSQFDHHYRYHTDYLALPHKDTGTYLTIYNVHEMEPISAQPKWPAGNYTVRVRIAALDDAPKERRFIEVFQRGQVSTDLTVLSSHQVTGTMAQPQILEIPVNVTSTGNREFAIREKQPNSRSAAFDAWKAALDKTGTGPKPSLWIDWIEIEGPASAQPAPVAMTAPQPQKLRKDPEQWANKYMPIYAEGYVEKYSRFQKWCAAIDEAAKKPENAAVVAKRRADPRFKTQPHLFYSGFANLKDSPQPTQFGFRDVDDAQFARSEYTYHHQYYADYAKLPARDTGTWLMLYSLGRYTGITASEKWPAGKYTLRIRLAASDESPKERRFIEIGTGKADAADFNVLSSHQVTGTLANPQTLEIPVEINASGDRNFAIRDKRPNTREAEYAMFREAWDKTGTGPRPCIWIDYVELEGPRVDAPSTFTKTIKQRREVELHANAMVGGTYNGYFKGGHEAAKKFLETGQPQKGIPDEQEAKFRVRVFEEHGPSFERYLNDPLTKTGAYLTIYNVHTEELITLPPDQPSGWLKTKHEVEEAKPGEYVLRFRIGAVKGTPVERRFVELGSRMKPEEREDFTLMQTFQISGTTDAPQTIEVPVSISAGGPRSFVLREKRDVKLDHELYQAARKETKVGPPSALWIDWVEWEGPLRKPAAEALTKTQRLEPESRRADVERGHLRYKYLNEQYGKWKAAGGDEARLKDFDFTDKSHAEFAKVVWDQNNRWFQQYLDRPLSKTGLYLDNTVQETSEHAVDLPADLPTGDYVMRVKIGRVPGMPDERAFLSFVEASPIDKDDRTFLANKQITAPIDAPEVVELPFRIRPGGPRKFILMEKRPLKKESISLPGRTRQIEDPKQRDPVFWIDWIEWEGPLGGGGSQTRIPPVLFPGETDPRAVLERFAARAFRGKRPSAAYLDKLTALHDARIAAGDPFDQAIREPLSAVLASPGFLYIQEIGTKERGKGNDSSDSPVPIPLSQPELASRLSYFLWSAPPDDALLEADLTDPGTLAREVDRLIASPKADEFVSGFVHQWLHLDRLDFFQFDTKQFRDFDESAKAAARREVYETFAHLLRNGGSLSRLLKSDEVHVNGLLATYYGIEGVSGDEFRPVKVPGGSPRGGLLGMAAVHAMGSNGERTSPVERGTWVLRYLLHNPPPPAPPNVPQLDRLDGKPVSPRERLAAHMEEAQCAQCHRKIDPIGFGLENFNAAGKWREVDYDPKTKKEWPIDPAGAFYNGPAFKDYFDLRDLVAARSDDFARGFTEALIEYGLGRPYGFTDDALASDIVARAKEEDFVIRGFIQALVSSGTFGRK